MNNIIYRAVLVYVFILFFFSVGSYEMLLVICIMIGAVFLVVF